MKIDVGWQFGDMEMTHVILIMISCHYSRISHRPLMHLLRL